MPGLAEPEEEGGGWSGWVPLAPASAGDAAGGADGVSDEGTDPGSGGGGGAHGADGDASGDGDADAEAEPPPEAGARARHPPSAPTQRNVEWWQDCLRKWHAAQVVHCHAVPVLYFWLL